MIKDGKNNNIVVPIEIETITYSHNVRININRIKSLYGFNNLRGYDLNDYIKKNLSENKFKKVYEKKNKVRALAPQHVLHLCPIYHNLI